MAKFRIVEETYANGKKVYEVQRRHWLFHIWWGTSQGECDFNTPLDRYDTLEEARKQLTVYENLYSHKIKTTVIDDN